MEEILKEAQNLCEKNAPGIVSEDTFGVIPGIKSLEKLLEDFFFRFFWEIFGEIQRKKPEE